MADLDDYVPCRDDKCKIEGVHPAHPEEGTDRKTLIEQCPECGGDIIRLSAKRGVRHRGMCARCDWRGSTLIAGSFEEEPIMKKLLKQHPKR